MARRRFDQHFKQRAVELARGADKPLAQVARDLGISESTLRNWALLDRQRKAAGQGNAAGQRKEEAPVGVGSSPAASSPGDHWATWGAARDGARTVLTRVQACAIALLAVPGAVLIGTVPRAGLIVCLAVITGLYLVTGVHKIWLLIRGELADASPAAGPLPPEPDGLPIYTVLVPLFREGRILPTLVERLKRLDYPPECLQVLLLIEPDDDETRRAADCYPFPPHIRPMLMSAGQPRTKPRALNIGLHEALGEYIVVYDAEDQPEPDQLRKAVAAMRVLPPDVVCLQARLNFYNRHQSVLTRLSAADYTLWYNQFLPG